MYFIVFDIRYFLTTFKFTILKKPYMMIKKEDHFGIQSGKLGKNQSSNPKIQDTTQIL